MLSFYGVCIIGVMALLFWGLDRRNQTISANATATGAVIATQIANSTATAVAHIEEQSQFEFIEKFDSVSGRWYVGPHTKQYGDATYDIHDGVYSWDVREAKEFSFSVDFYKGNKISNFDAFVDIKFVENNPGSYVCPGMAFRKPTKDYANGAFIFSICADMTYKVQYYDSDGWGPITYNHSDLILPEDWNRIEIHAKNDKFVFSINSIQVFEMTDERLEQGGLALFLEVPVGESAEVWFDNFGFQSR
jgi:hypothetical protein